MDPNLLVAIVAAAVALGGSWFLTRGDRGRIRDLEGQVERLWTSRRADALTLRRQGDHIDLLEDHIWQSKPPPPPTRPDGV